MSNKRVPLGDLAQMLSDAYYRDLKSDDEFFDMVHFAFVACTAYAKILQDIYSADKQQNKDGDGFSYVNISSEWLLTEVCKIQDDKVTGFKYIATAMPTFSFDVDAMSSAIHSILKPPGAKCGDFIRLSNKDYWKIASLPKTSDIFCYKMGEKILLPNLTCDPGDPIVNYIPALLPENLECTVPETMQAAILTTALQIMFGAKNETMVVKMDNNGNPNTTPVTELAPEQVKQVTQNQ